MSTQSNLLCRHTVLITLDSPARVDTLTSGNSTHKAVLFWSLFLSVTDGGQGGILGRGRGGGGGWKGARRQATTQPSSENRTTEE